MLQKNNFFIGLAIGILLPLIGYALLLELYDQLDGVGLSPGKGWANSVRPRTTALFALCLNLIPFQLFYRKKFTQSMRGISLPTIVWGVLWFIRYGEDLF